MNNNNKLIVISLFVGLLVVVLTSSYLSINSFSINNKFVIKNKNYIEEGKESNSKEIELVNNSFFNNYEWGFVSYYNSDYPLPLFSSTYIVESNGKIFVLNDPKEDLLRPPLENSWILKNNLNPIDPNILNSDTDGDGFVALDEWEGKTDPNDLKSHPPYTRKLKMLKIEEVNYDIKYIAQPSSKLFQLKRIKNNQWERSDFYMKVGDVSKDNMIKLESAGEEDQYGDIKALYVVYLSNNRRVELIKKEKVSIVSKFVNLNFSFNSINKTFKVKEGDFLPLSKTFPDQFNYKYKVKKINSNNTIVTEIQKNGSKKDIIVKNKLHS